MSDSFSMSCLNNLFQPPKISQLVSNSDQIFYLLLQIYIFIFILLIFRLCSDPAVCKELISLRGLDSLVQLVKDGSLRNYNDAVLVACLAVLRRVAHHCGHQVFDSLDARDLIDPKLMDSFLEYSSKQESYV